MEETVTGRWNKLTGRRKFVNTVFLIFHAVVVEFTSLKVIIVCNKLEPNIKIGFRYFALIWGIQHDYSRYESDKLYSDILCKSEVHFDRKCLFERYL
jgi:hypothetical protein